MNISECYVCAELNAPLSSCNCKNMYIHEECQILTIKKLNTYNCTICKGSYKNINISITTMYKLTKQGNIIIILILLFMSSAGISFYELYVYLKLINDNVKEIELEITLITFCICFFLASIIIYSILCFLSINMYRNNIPIFYKHKTIIPRLKSDIYRTNRIRCMHITFRNTNRIRDISDTYENNI
jgi:hypothetical protein